MINILKFEDNSLDFDEKLQYHYEMLFKNIQT